MIGAFVVVANDGVVNCLYFLLKVPSKLSRTFLRESSLQAILDRAIAYHYQQSFCTIRSA